MDTSNSNKQANNHSKIVSFVWRIADEVLRHTVKPPQYRDIILPMVLLRRLDALLEDTKEDIIKEYEKIRNARGKDFELSSCDAIFTRISKYKFYNTSKWTLNKLKEEAGNDEEVLLRNFKEYLYGFSGNIKSIIQNFELEKSAETLRLASAGKLLAIIEKLTDKKINLSDKEVIAPDGTKLPPLTNADMGTIVEELIRKFNEADNANVGQFFTPRDAIKLLTQLIFVPNMEYPKTISIYDPACGTGGMLISAYDYLTEELNFNKNAITLSGNENEQSAYAVCKTDMIIKDLNCDNIFLCNTISGNKQVRKFGYMISNPPYGTAWTTEKKIIFEGKTLLDDRFNLKLHNYKGEEELVASVPRVSDGQLLFLLEVIDKMYPLTKQAEGSRAAIIFNGSSLFTGDAGQGESNIRRYVVENDYVEAIIQLPNNIFYNTGIATYVWVITNKKEENRKNKIQLIDASQAFKKLRKSLGNRNCEITQEHQGAILKAYMNFSEEENELTNSKIFDNDDFRYYSVKINRPLRLRCQFSAIKLNEMCFPKTKTNESMYIYKTYGQKVYEGLTEEDLNDIKEYFDESGIKVTDKQLKELVNTKKWNERKAIREIATKLMPEIGEKVFMDYNEFEELLKSTAIKLNLKVKDTEIKTIAREMSEVDPEAEPVIKEIVTTKKANIQELINIFGVDKKQLGDYGFHACKEKDKFIVYEADKNLNDVEKISVKEENIYDYFCKEVKPYASDAWIDLLKTEIGCEISFNKYFYKPSPLRTLAENEADIRNLENSSIGIIQTLFEN